MSDLNDLIATNSINAFNQGVQTGARQEQERIIKLIEGWAYPRYVGASSSTRDEIELLEDLIEAIKGENK
jgi:hypothetical protein